MLVPKKQVRDNNLSLWIYANPETEMSLKKNFKMVILTQIGF